jgi:L-seryl-tRNA(Ser) seleniumtransferase
MDSTIYRELGVRPIINGVGTVTVLGGSIMPAEVANAMVMASKHFVDVPELQRKAGQRIAELIGVPAAMITCGAASAITVAAAGCVTRGDSDLLARLPDTGGMRNQIVRQRSQGAGYQSQLSLVGVETVWVDTLHELTQALNNRPAMTMYMNYADDDGSISRGDWLRASKDHSVPTFNDAAADVPPSQRLREYVEEGFDLVAFSGGKGLGGPQASGLLLGRRDLIEAAQQAICPNSGIGRGMKVGKEEIVGLTAAVVRYLKIDHDAERRAMDARAVAVAKALDQVDGVTAKTWVPEIANHVPHVLVNWDEFHREFSAEAAVRMLREGEPPIALSAIGPRSLRISMWTLQEGEDRIVGQQLRKLFS